jgi:hypothetical protein
MKKFLLILFLFFLMKISSAQLFTHVGGSVGFGQSKILGERSDFERVKDVQNFSLGVAAEHRFDAPILFTIGVNFTGFGDSTIYKRSFIANNTTTTTINRYKNMRYYMQVPLCIGLNIRLGKDKANLLIKGGAYYGSLLGSRTTGKESVVSGSMVADTIIDTKGYFPYSKNDFGWIAALGYGTDRYSVEVRFNKGLVSLFSQPADLPKYNFAYIVTLSGYLPN